MANENTLTITNISLYQDSLGLLNAYNRIPEWRNTFKTRLLEGKNNYNGRPLRFYVWLFAQINPIYKEDYLGLVEPERFLEILEEFYKNNRDRNHLEDQVSKLVRGEINHPDFISEEEHQQITELDSKSDSEQKTDSFDSFVEQKSQAAHTQHIVSENQHLPVETPAATSSMPTSGIPSNPVPIIPISPNLSAPANFKPVSESIISQPPNPDTIPGTSPIPEVFTKSFEQLKNETFTQQTAKPTTPPTTTSHIQTPSLPKTRSSFFAVFKNIRIPKLPVTVERNIRRFTNKFLTPSAIARGFTGIIGASMGWGVTHNPLGLSLGLAGGLAAPSAFKNQGFTENLLSIGGRFGNGGADFISGISSRGSSIRGNLSRAGGRIGGIGGAGGKKWALLLLFLLFGVALFGLLGFAPPGTNAPGGPGSNSNQNVQITKTGDATVQNGDPINYKIVVTYKGTGTADIQVVDTLPSGITVTDDGGGKVNGQTITWTLAGVGANVPKTLNLVTQTTPDADDTWIQNKANATITSSGGSINTGPNTPPNSDNCSGKYTLRNPLGNFGDPKCSFTQEDLYKLLKQTDPSEADYWFYTVVRCESGYNPNAYANSVVVGTPDAAGAWGLFQMGRGKNGQYDHGDVAWENQTSNAVNYNKKLAKPWTYWQCTKNRW